MDKEQFRIAELIAYRGKALRDMSREELIEAIAVMTRQMNEQYKRHREDITWLGSMQPRRDKQRGRS